MWCYKFAYDEVDEMLANRPWLMVDDQFPSEDQEHFLRLQKQHMLEKGWDWFTKTYRGRVFTALNLTTITSLEREKDPKLGDPPPELVEKIQQNFPGLSLVSLIGKPHWLAGPEVSPDALNAVSKVAAMQLWRYNLQKKANWRYPAAAIGGGALAWLASLALPPVQHQQAQIDLEQGMAPQEIAQKYVQAPVEEFQEPIEEFEAPVEENMPLGIRNNNPGNIELGEEWQGMSNDQGDGRFIQFESPEYGIRAMARVLRNYQRRHNINTIEGIVSRWAPSSENDSAAYIEHISQETGWPSDHQLNLEDDNVLHALIIAMIEHENGMNTYDSSTTMEGIRLEKSSSFHYAFEMGDQFEARAILYQLMREYGDNWNFIVNGLIQRGVSKNMFGYLQRVFISRLSSVDNRLWQHHYA